MRLLILSLLALGAQAHSISYRNNLLAFAPARGEFPVQAELAQGYLRYLDSTGAERLVGFNYPEPLHGIRSDNKLEAQQQQHLAMFRAWCEQRYDALRIELERLRAEGKQPSANILAQFEPLEQIIKTNAFEPVPGLSPEVQRARDEHLRIWNENRLQVLQAKVTQGDLKTSQSQPQSQTLIAKLPQEKIQIKQSFSTFNVPLEAPKPVQETDEVLRAREEHLRRYNEALQAQIKTPVDIPILKANTEPQQAPQTLQTPQPVEETPEVKRAREEHLKQYNAELQRQSVEAQQQQQQQPLAPLPTAAVKIASAIRNTQLAVPIPTKQSIHDQKIEDLNQSKIKAEDQVADIEDLIRIEQMDRDAERIREQQLRREERKQAELEREREQLRLLEEQQLLEAERISLQQQEKQRIEEERLQESKRLQAEQQIIFTVANAPAEPGSSYKLIAPTPVKPQSQPQAAQPQSVAQQQQVQNGFFLRIQSGQPSAEPLADGIQSQNPFLIRYIQQPQQAQVKVSPSSSPSSASSNAVPTGLSELDKATREHFKAHEIALEQLRLANLKGPEASPIPCLHEH
ncbi:hypothetical protein ACLKA7_012343 [Drosophila subpalustris]